MKIGITLPRYYEDYLTEIAKVNGLSITTICGLVLENYLSYNKANKRVPLFQRKWNVVYAKKQQPDDGNNYEGMSDDEVNQRAKSLLSRDEMLAEINIDNEQYKLVEVDDELPF